LADRDFMPKYHRAMVLANKPRLEQMKAMVASGWVKEWQEQLAGPLTDETEFAAKLEDFLIDGLGFAEGVKVAIEGDELTIDVSGCAICPGNEQLRQRGEPTFCPILATGLQAISRVLGKKTTLLGADKTGRPIGFCAIKYKLADKRP